jgi:hypothetical protein
MALVIDSLGERYLIVAVCQNIAASALKTLSIIRRQSSHKQLSFWAAALTVAQV